jgi:hypothetical protein
MISIPQTIAWYAFLFSVLWVFQRLTRWSTSLSIFSLFLGFLIMRHGITVPFDHTVNQWFAGIDISPAAYRRYYTSLVLMWLCLLAGTWLARAWLGRAELNPRKFSREMAADRLATGVSPLFIPVLVGCIAMVMIYQLHFDTNLWLLLSGHLTGAQYRAMRDLYGESTHYSLGAGYRVASIIRFGVVPMFLYTLYFARGRGMPAKTLFAVVLAIALLVGLASGQKSPAIFLLIGLGLAAYYRRGRLRLRLAGAWLLTAVCALWFGVLPYLYHLQYPTMDYSWLLRSTTYRLTSENDRSLQLYFQVYPDVHAHLNGRSSSLVDAILGIKVPPEELPERFIPLHYVPNPEDYHNTWNAAYVGVAWADFGYAGVVLESMLVGMLLYAYARWFSRARKTALVMGTQVALMMAATKLSEVPLTSTLLSFGLLSSFGLFLFLQAPSRQAAAGGRAP